MTSKIAGVARKISHNTRRNYRVDISLGENEGTASRMPAAHWSRLAAELAATEIAFVDHPEFRRRGAERWLQSLEPAGTSCQLPAVSSPVNLAFVSGFVRAPVLSPEHEVYLFLRMNYLKFLAEKDRRKIRPKHPDVALIQAVQEGLAEANSIRNMIVESNLRLVVSLARKLSRSLSHLSELIGEGVLPLMRAVELFDVHRGNRFSTYATWAVRNQLLRTLQKKSSQPVLRDGADIDLGSLLVDHRSTDTADSRTCEKQRQFLTALIGVLGDRERFIVSARFGLDGQPSGQSLTDISQKLGLSKERVRQIVLQSLSKLRVAASTCDAEIPVDWHLLDEET